MHSDHSMRCEVIWKSCSLKVGGDEVKYCMSDLDIYCCVLSLLESRFLGECVYNTETSAAVRLDRVFDRMCGQQRKMS